MEPAVGPGPGGFGLGGRARLRRRFGHGVMKKMMDYCGISEKEMTSTRNYPYMSSRTLAKLWVGTCWSYYRETNSRSAWARGLYAHPLNSFIDRGLSTPTRSKPGWYPGGAGGAAQPAGMPRRRGQCSAAGGECCSGASSRIGGGRSLISYACTEIGPSHCVSADKVAIMPSYEKEAAPEGIAVAAGLLHRWKKEGEENP